MSVFDVAIFYNFYRKAKIMYLTEEEFIILKGFKNGTPRAEINKQLLKTLKTNDCRVDALYQKYGAMNIIQLLEKADWEKVEVCQKENIPYWKYNENDQLISEIYLSKNDIERLMNLVKNEKDANKRFKLTYCDNGGFYQEIKLDTNKHYC